MRKYWESSLITILLALGVNHLSWAQDCTPKVDYNEMATCSDDFFIAKNIFQLNQYSSDFGFENGQYKSLRIAFSLNEDDLNIHSPCSIEIISRTTLMSNSICLDARQELKINDNVTIQASDSIKSIAQKGDVIFKGRISLVSMESSFSTSQKLRIHEGGNVEVQGSFSGTSSGTDRRSFILIGENSTLRADILNLSAQRQVIIGKNSNIISTGRVSFQSRATSAFGHVKIEKGARIEASNFSLSSQNVATLGALVKVTAPAVDVSAIGCRVSPRAVINTNISTGSCLLENANRYPRITSLVGDSLVGTSPLLVNFLASARDPDGLIASFTWDFGDGTQGTGSSISHTYESEGNYIATLVVEDSMGAKIPSQLSIQVGGDLPPTANSGEDARAILRTIVNLSGAASSDPEGSALRYSWQLSSAPTGSMAILAGRKTRTPFFIPDKIGDYIFSLVVSDETFSSSPDMVTITVSDSPNLAPTLNSIGNKSVVLGSELKFKVSGLDADKDSISYQVSPIPLLSNASFNGRMGEFSFHPNRSQVGTHKLTFVISDGRASAKENITITVTAPPIQPTRLMGKVLDTNAMTGDEQEIPIVGASVSILVNNVAVSRATTNARGEFRLDSIPQAGPHVLKIETSTAQPGPGGVIYADFIEPLHLIQGADNVVSRPFFLPRLDMSSLASVTSGQPTQVMNTNLGVELSIPANSVVNQDGTVFSGGITVSEVPRNLAPISLPEKFNPSMLITIQPAGIRFSTPASVTFPNSMGLAVGNEVDIYSIDPQTGAFTVTGKGRVSSDGSKIQTFSGGIRGATWHFVTSRPADLDVDGKIGNQDCANSGCRIGCKGPGCPSVGSSSPLSEGYLLESYDLVSYRSLGIQRALMLSYSSYGASPRPIIAADARMPGSVLPPVSLSVRIRIGGVERPNVFYTNTNGMDSIIGNDVRQKIIYDASLLESGLYDYELLVTSHFRDGSSVMGTATGKTMVVNQRQSDFGSGWSLQGQHHIYKDASGDIMLRFGNSDVKRFLRQDNGSFLSPDGDYSVLRIDGTKYTRTLKDGTKYTFNPRGLLESIKDRNGNITLYCYRVGTDQLKYIEDPTGKRTHFTYNSDGRVESIRNPGDKLTRLSYDALGNLILITAPDSSTRRFQYDEEHRLVGQLMENGRMSSYIYDEFGRVSGSIDNDGITTGVSSVAINGLEGALMGQGTSTNPLPVMRPLNVKGSFTNKNGQRSIFKVNEFGSIVERADALGQISQILRDKNNNPTQVTDALGQVTVNEYDSKGNLISSTDRKTGAVTHYTYESKFNQVSSIQNPKGGRTSFIYDALGNLIQVTDANGQITKLSYNNVGQVETQTDSLGNVSKFFYDDVSGHLISSIDALGNITKLTYDSSGNLLTQIDGKGNRTVFEYDVMNRVRKIIDAKNGETLLSYDVIGNILSVRDAKGNTTSFSYDLENRLTKRTDPSGREDVFSYDAEGNLLRQVNRKGGVTTFEYDALNRLVRKALGRKTISYTYDALGNVVTLIDRDSRLSYRYNSRNQVTSVSTEGSPYQPSLVLSYSYDLNGNRIGTSTPFGNISYAYDEGDRQTGLGHGERNFTFIYDGASRLVKRTYPNGFKTYFSYDRSSRLLGINHKNQSNQIIAGLNYVYDKVGNRIEKSVERPGLQLTPRLRYTYDKLNQLLSATNLRSSMPTETFSYDGVGNRLRRDGEIKDSLFNINNQLLDDKTYSYSYNANGNLIEKEHKINGQVIFYSWNRENRLIEITEHPSTTSRASKRVLYRYDVLGRRIEKRIRTNISIKTVRYVYDGEDILLEYNKDNERVASYIHGQGIDNPLSMTRSNADYYYHQDGLNSIIMLTNASGMPVQHYAYDAYGSPSVYGPNGVDLTIAGILVENPYLYIGREYDVESGLYYLRARTYNPETGRFLSAEPTGIDGPNLYWYALNNPINIIDPTGLYGFAVQTSGAFGASNRPEASTGSVVEASSGFAVSVEKGGVVAKGIVSSGTGSQIRGITGGAGLSITVFGGDVSSLGGAGTAETIVFGIFSFTKLKNDRGETVGYSLGTPFGKGLGLASFITNTKTKLGSLFNIGGNKKSCPLQK